MASEKSYIYGTETGTLYWEGYDPFNSVYRHVIGVEKSPWLAREKHLEWAEELDEDLSVVHTRFGKIGFAIGKLRRRFRRFLDSKSYTRYSRRYGHKVRVSAYDWLMFLLQWTFILSGVAALVGAFTVLAFPFNVLAGMYGAAVAVWFVKAIS